MLGKGTLAHGAVPTSLWGHDPEPSRYVEDLDKAASLLEQAGHTNGLELTFSYDPTEQTMAELWQANLAKIGVTLKLDPADFPIRWDAAKSAPENAPQAFILVWSPDVVDPYSYLFNMFHSEEQPLWNLGFYNDPAFDTLVDQARRQSALDQTAASALYVNAQGMLADDAAAIYALDLPEFNVIANDIQGFVTNPAYSHLVIWYDVRREK
jgi:peptide/nickel transport system substrate-binding protein